MQRVSSANVQVREKVVGSISKGLVVFVGVSNDDDELDARYIVNKCLNLRIFSDCLGKFQFSALDVQAELLVISQFTLYADTRKGRRPNFTTAASPNEAKSLFSMVLSEFQRSSLNVSTGEFGSHMLVSIVNDGPVSIILDSPDKAVDTWL